MVRVFECSSRMDLARVFLTLDRRYGANNKISFAILGGHGEQDAMTFGDLFVRPGKTFLGGRIFKDILKRPGFQRLKNFFVDKPAIVLVSCSTGKPEGLADTIAKEFPHSTVTAPIEDTYMKSIEPVITDQGLEFKVEYGTAGIAATYQSSS